MPPINCHSSSLPPFLLSNLFAPSDQPASKFAKRKKEREEREGLETEGAE